MKYAQVIAAIITAVGVLMIIFAKQLAILKEGPQYSMSDLGFITGGMMLAILGFVTLLILFGWQMWKGSQKRTVTK